MKTLRVGCNIESVAEQRPLYRMDQEGELVTNVVHAALKMLEGKVHFLCVWVCMYEREREERDALCEQCYYNH